VRRAKDVWQDAFDDALDEGETALFASKAADEAVVDFLARRADDAYDRYRDAFGFVPE
jgi:hypothetical protein